MASGVRFWLFLARGELITVVIRVRTVASPHASRHAPVSAPRITAACPEFESTYL